MSEMLKLGRVTWEFTARDMDPVWVPSDHDPNELVLIPHPDSKIVDYHKEENMVVRGGRVDVLQHIMGGNCGSPINTGFIYLGVGSGTNAALVTDTALQTELTGNANRFLVTNFSGAPLSSAAISQSTSGGFDQLLQIQAVMLTGDGNNSATVSEAALFSNQTFGNPTMWNRFVFSGIVKSGSISLTIQLSIRD